MKQRLVGALVLLSGGVVLWSLLFTGPAAYKVSRSTQLPPPPVIAEVADIVPQKPVDIPPPEPVQLTEKDLKPDDAQSAGTESVQEVREGVKTARGKTVAVELTQATEKEPEVPAPKPVSSTEEKTPALDSSTTLPKGWVLQVASFVEKGNAEKLKNRLQAAGYKAYVQRVSVASGDRYRVMVGPVLNKAKAEQDQKSIQKQFSLKPLIQRFQR